jgi:hypothetical protein
VLCAVRRPFPLLAWAAIPVLFTAAVLGLTSLGEVLLSMPASVTVTSAHLGASAAVTAMMGLSMEWPPAWRWARVPYPVAVFAAGLALHGLEIPAIPALIAGLSSLAVLARITRLHRPSRKRAAHHS